MTREWMAKRAARSPGTGGALGGPYFNPAQCGAQSVSAMRTPDDGSADALLQCPGVLRMLTLAPELPGAPALIRRLCELGIVPAAGHSDARDSDLSAAIRAGLRHVVHLWSGQSSTVREGPWRRPGILEASLVSDELSGEVIADGKHLPTTLLRLAWRSKGPERLCVVSDATSGAGLPDGTALGGAETYGEGRVRIEVRDDGTAWLEVASQPPVRLLRQPDSGYRLQGLSGSVRIEGDLLVLDQEGGLSPRGSSGRGLMDAGWTGSLARSPARPGHEVTEVTDEDEAQLVLGRGRFAA